MKQPDRLLAAFAALAHDRPSLRLAFVGPVAAGLRRDLETTVADLGLGDSVIVTGVVGAAEYQQWLATTTVAVQLRAAFSGEASAAVGDCLSSGIPTVVTGIGWLGELPNDVAVKVAPDVGAAELAGAIADLLDDPAERARRREAGRRYSLEHSFEAAAAALLAVVSGRALLAG